MSGSEIRNNRIRGRLRRGVSLVEVLVVLVILTIGIFAVTRLFPEGFVSLSLTQNRTLAHALAQRELDFLRTFRENLPDGVVALDPATGLVRSTVLPGEVFGTRPYTDNAINGYSGPPPPDPRYSGVNVSRRVIGETFRIPPPTTGYGPNQETVSLYRPLFGPLYSAANLGASSPGVAAYSGTPLQRVVVVENPPSAEERAAILQRGAYGYGIDYDRGVVYFLSVDYERRFRIDYTFRTAPGAASQSVPDNCIYLPADPNAFPNPDANGNVKVQAYNLRTGAPQPPDCRFVPLPGGAVLDPGSDLVYRRFRQIALSNRFSPDPSNGRVFLDPYEFKVYDSLFGLFGFHPVGASLPIPRQEGRGLIARMDYDVDDWHILRQDEVVPLEVVDVSRSPNGFHALKLSTTSVKQAGDQEDTVNFLRSSLAGGTVDTDLAYQTLVRDYPAGPGSAARQGTPLGVDLVIVDLQTGYLIDSRTLQNPTVSQTGNNLNGQIDYAAGVIHLREQVTLSPPYGLGGPALPNVRMAGRHVRIFYRTHNDFAVATVKPYSTFYLQPAVAGLGDRQYTPWPGGYLLFATAEAERTVAVDYSFLSPRTPPNQPPPPNQRRMTEIGELQRLQPPGAAGDPGAGRWWVLLSRAGDPDVDPASIELMGVRGASLHARVVWREGGRTRHVERNTILSREQAR